MTALLAAIVIALMAHTGGIDDRLAHANDPLGTVLQMRRGDSVRNAIPDAPELSGGVPRADGNADGRTVLRIHNLSRDGIAEPYAPEPVPELTPEPPPVKEVPVYQPNVERWRGLVASVFPEWAVDTVLRIMDCESEGLPEATGRLGERGLMQIHPIHHDSTYDPLANLWAAYRISRGGTDWSAWSCS